MNPLNSSIRTEYEPGAGNYVFLGDYRICRYDPTDGMLYFRGRIMRNIEYGVRVEDFLRAVETQPVDTYQPSNLSASKIMPRYRPY